MAAGRHAAHRGTEYREREFNVDVSRRASNNSKEDNDQIRSGSRETGRGQSRYAKARIRARQKDIREREVLNDSYQSSSSRSNSGGSNGGLGPRQFGLSLKAMDREPGELSSESGSDDALESEPQVEYCEDANVEGNGPPSPSEKKRKFSPVVWDQDGKEMNNSSKVRVSTTVNSLPPPPPLLKTLSQSPYPSFSGVETPSGKNKENGIELSNAVKLPLPSEMVEDAESESHVGFPSFSPELSWTDNQEAEQLEREDYVPTHNILSSRWPAGDDSPGDEGEIMVDKVAKRRRRLSPEPLENRARNMLLISEEPKREGLEKARAAESEERGSHCRISCGKDYLGIGSDNDDYMEIDGQDGKSDTDDDQLDTDSEDVDDHWETPEPPAPPERVVYMLHGCRSVDEFERLNKIDEGTYGVVYRTRDKKIGEIVESEDGKGKGRLSSYFS